MVGCRISGEVLVAVFLVLVSTALTSYGAEYRITKGSQYELCKKFEENLNSLISKGPMACKMEVNALLDSFEIPAWVLVNRKLQASYLNMIYKAHEAKGSRFSWSGEDTNIWKAGFDIGNDGAKETVLKVEIKSCNPVKQARNAVPISPFLYVVSKGGETLDPVYSRLVGDASQDVIFFQGKTYLSEWVGLSLPNNKNNGGLAGHVFVYETFMARGKFGIKNKPICKFDYWKDR